MYTSPIQTVTIKKQRFAYQTTSIPTLVVVRLKPYQRIKVKDLNNQGFFIQGQDLSDWQTEMPDIEDLIEFLDSGTEIPYLEN